MYPSLRLPPRREEGRNSICSKPPLYEEVSAVCTLSATGVVGPRTGVHHQRQSHDGAPLRNQGHRAGLPHQRARGLCLRVCDSVQGHYHHQLHALGRQGRGQVGRGPLRQLRLPCGDDGLQALRQGKVLPGAEGGHGYHPPASGRALPGGGRGLRRGQSHCGEERHRGVQRLLLPGGRQRHAQGPAAAHARHGNHGRRQGEVQRRGN